MDDLSELLLRIVSDSNPRPLCLGEVIDPLVTLGELPNLVNTAVPAKKRRRDNRPRMLTI